MVAGEFLLHGTSTPGKGAQGCDVASVCGSQRRDVFLPSVAGIDQAPSAPGEARALQTFDEQIGHEPGMTAVAVWEGMNADQTMVETDGDLVGRIAGAENPR